MLSNKTLKLFLIGSPIVFFSCNDQITDSTDEGTNPSVPEVIYPVNFRCLTLNHEGSGGDKPSISYIHNDGSVIADFFKQANGSGCVPDPRSATQIKEKLLIPHSSYWPVQSQQWTQNGIFMMDANTFVCEKDFNLGSDYMPYAVQDLGGDSVLVVGETKNDAPNMIVGYTSNTPDNFVKRTFNIDFPVNRVMRVGNKIIVAGNKKQSNGVYTYSKLGVLDIEDLNTGKVKVLLDKVNLSSRYSSVLKDKNQRIWIGNEAGSSYVLQCVDLNSGKLVHEVEMPFTMSNMNELALTMDNRGEYIYLRNYKAFYMIAVDNPQTPDEPLYEYRAHVGSLNDLQMTKEGNLLFLNEVLTPFRPSELIEIKPSVNQPWEIVKITETGSVAKSIYVAKYEKNY
ncbi:MAG: hypothetical protein ACRCX4_07240 [Bacteroidales bacterium]